MQANMREPWDMFTSRAGQVVAAASVRNDPFPGREGILVPSALLADRLQSHAARAISMPVLKNKLHVRSGSYCSQHGEGG
jgi:predicted membrane GTPase involved in stress response